MVDLSHLIGAKKHDNISELHSKRQIGKCSNLAIEIKNTHFTSDGMSLPNFTSALSVNNTFCPFMSL